MKLRALIYAIQASSSEVLLAASRIAVVGCGAVTQRYYVPALKQVNECDVRYFVDSNKSNAQRAARAFGSGDVVSNYLDTIDGVDAAIVAVPNQLHSIVSIPFLRAGRPVLCEKPIASDSKSALEMIQASKDSGARLSVNLIRRRFESYQILRELLGKSLIGNIGRITYREGTELSWPFSSSYALSKDKSGGGVLIDWGTHSLDLLNWLFGHQWELLSYKDDNLGRIESNCIIDFRIEWHHRPIPCHVELSYARKLGRKMVIDGELGELDVDVTRQTNQLELRIGRERVLHTDDNIKSTVSYFADQIRSFLSSAPDDCLAGEDALNSLQFIEQCYTNKKNLSYPWNETATTSPRVTHTPTRVLIVGGSGFLGSRLAERLTLEFGLNVRATYHRPERAVRLARLPLELQECNILEYAQVLRAVKDCDVIVNCAIGTSTDGRQNMRVYNQGTRNLLEAAIQCRVEKFVHISTAAVSNFKQHRETVDETCPFKHWLTRSAYEKGKIAQERIVRAFGHSIPTVILRPTIIYGPFSKIWAIGIVNSLVEGRPTLVENGGFANLVYVDDVIDAIILAITKEAANGKTFIINNDEERIPWANYVTSLASFLSVSPNILPEDRLVMIRLRKLFALCVDSLRETRNNFRSREMITMLTRVPLVVKLGTTLMSSERRRDIEDKLISSEGPTDSSVLSYFGIRRRMAKYETVRRASYENLTSHTVFSSSLVKAILGWNPLTPYQEGFKKTLQWVEWAFPNSEY